MLEINKWAIVLLINFLALLFFLNVILFKPLLKIFKERESTIKGSLDDAKAMAEKKDKALTDVKAGLAAASKKAKEAFESVRSEGLDKQRELLSKASAEASSIAGKAKADLRNEAERARQSLRADVEKLSEEVVRKILAV